MRATVREYRLLGVMGAVIVVMFTIAALLQVHGSSGVRRLAVAAPQAEVATTTPPTTVVVPDPPRPSSWNAQNQPVATTVAVTHVSSQMAPGTQMSPGAAPPQQAAPPVHNIIGSFDVVKTVAQGTAAGTACGAIASTGGPGSTIVVKDGAGSIIGTATAGMGTRVPVPDNGFGSGWTICRYPFTVADVPEAAFYQVVIDMHGAATMSLQEMVKNSWHVDLQV